MIPIMREPTGLIIIPLRTEHPPPLLLFLLWLHQALARDPPASSDPGSQDLGPAGYLEIYSLEFKTYMFLLLRHTKAIALLSPN